MKNIILFFPLVLIVIGIVFIIPSIRPKLFRLLSWKISALAAGLYLGILIILSPILYLLPDKDFIKSVENREETITASQSLLNSVYNQQHPLTEDEIAGREGVYKNSSYSFNVTSHKLSFDIQRGPVNHHIFIERKAIDDGIIDVSTYITAHFIGNIDFSNQILPPKISLQNDILLLQSPNIQMFEFKQLNYDFTVDQFKSNSRNLNMMSTNYGGQIVYLHVPPSLEINGIEDQNLIHLIN